MIKYEDIGSDDNGEKREGKAHEDDELVDVARKRYSEATSSDKENNELALDDLRFLAGEQWDAQTKQEREDAGRPCLTINRLPTFLAQIEGDMRLNRPSVKVRPVENADEETADVIEGMIRSIEDGSDAQSVYSSAGVSAAACGRGHFRLVLEEPDDETFEADIRIKRITNPFAVIWDPMATHPVKADARYCFVVDRMAREDFKEAYPNASEDDYYSEHNPDEGWRDEDSVTIAEYWCVKHETKMLVEVPDPEQAGQYTTLSLDDAEYAELKSTFEMSGHQIRRERKANVPKVVSYILSGSEVLAGPVEWPGKRIPIFPVWGREIHVGDRVVQSGMIRYAKDSQRLFNYMRSASAEMIGLAPKSPYLVTSKMVAGHEADWDKANTENRMYLTYTPDAQAPGGPQRQQPPMVQSALLQESALASDDLKSTTGMYDAALGNRSNETSGIAIQQRQRESDVGSYVFQDNLNRAVRACGSEMVAIIPKVYTTERQVRILGKDMSAKVVKVNSGSLDLGRGKYDVSISTGPGFSTQRQEASDLFTRVIQGNPQAMMMFGDIWASSLDVPGADELKERFDELRQPQQQAPDPKDQLDAAKGQAELEGKQLLNAQRKFDLSKDVGELQQVIQQTVMQTLAAAAQQGFQPTPQANAAPSAPGGQPGMMPPAM